MVVQEAVVAEVAEDRRAAEAKAGEGVALDGRRAPRAARGVAVAQELVAPALAVITTVRAFTPAAAALADLAAPRAGVAEGPRLRPEEVGAYEEAPPREGLRAAIKAPPRPEEAIRAAEEAVVPVVPAPAKASTGRAASAVRDGVEGVGRGAKGAPRPAAIPTA